MRNNRKGVEAAIRAAVKKWSNVSRLTIDEATDISKADIVFQFVRGDHGHGKSFSGGATGHAFYPAHGGDVCFNDYYNWTVDPTDNTGIDLFHVALHETGHSLGLAHSTDSNAVMWPHYKMSGGNPRSLTQCDIDGIRGIYGRPKGSCNDSYIDARINILIQTSPWMKQFSRNQIIQAFELC